MANDDTGNLNDYPTGRAEQTISKEQFWTKLDEACSPLLGNGPKEILNEGNCLYIAAVMASATHDQEDRTQNDH